MQQQDLPRKRTMGNLSRSSFARYRRDARMRSPFLLQIKCELCSLRTSSIIINWYWELTTKITDSIFIKEECQFENDSTTSLIIGQIPDALTQNGIYHCPNLILSAPYGIEVCHRTIFAFWRLSKSLQKSDSSDSLKPLSDNS